MIRRLLLPLLLWPTLLWAQVSAPTTVEIREESVSQGFIRALDCTGVNVTCSRSGLIGTINIPVIDLSTGAVTGTLPFTSGGTGATAFAADRIPYSTGSLFTSASNFTFNGTTFTTPGQVAFPATQNSSANANTLDDYEEGTWTPVLGGSGGTSGQTYSAQVGSYIKIGKIVFFQAYIAITNKGTITGLLELQGLPFATENVSNTIWSWNVGYFAALTTSVTFIAATASPNSSVGLFRMLTTAATGTTNMTGTDISNTTELAISGYYRATQ